MGLHLVGVGCSLGLEIAVVRRGLVEGGVVAVVVVVAIVAGRWDSRGLVHRPSRQSV